MSAAREEILGRIRAALADVPESELPADVPVPGDYRRRGTRGPDELVSVLAQRLEDYHAEVRRVDPEGLAQAVTEDQGLSAEELDQIDGAITGCAGAIAETGTLILGGQGVCGRRVVTLIPDHHICVVGAAQIVDSVPEGIAAVRTAVVEEGAPITLISGPSASSDIELSRVEGVHGPRHLRVLIVTATGAAAAASNSAA
jgi:L-lactate dehydrogenase complex protein LldG